MKYTTADIFERLRNGETISSNDPQSYQMREASLATKQLLVQMSNASKSQVIKDLLGQITNSAIDGNTTIFTPFHINYRKHTKIGKNVFISFDCVFLDLGGITIEDNVRIAPKVSLLTEGHPISIEDRHSLIPKPIHINRNSRIGANATMLPGVTIGENSIVAAGVVVSKNVAVNAIVSGVPATFIKNIYSIN